MWAMAARTTGSSLAFLFFFFSVVVAVAVAVVVVLEEEEDGDEVEKLLLLFFLGSRGGGGGGGGGLGSVVEAEVEGAAAPAAAAAAAPSLASPPKNREGISKRGRREVLLLQFRRSTGLVEATKLLMMSESLPEQLAPSPRQLSRRSAGKRRGKRRMSKLIDSSEFFSCGGSGGLTFFPHYSCSFLFL